MKDFRWDVHRANMEKVRRACKIAVRQLQDIGIKSSVGISSMCKLIFCFRVGRCSRRCNIIIGLRRIQTEKKSVDSKDSFDEGLEQVFDHSPT